MNERADGEPFADLTEIDLGERFAETGYVADDELLTTVFLALKLGKPLLVEGDPGSGKTELGKALADGFDAELIRLQCYEGLTAENTLYEWNYTKQLLAIRSGERSIDETNSVFDSGFLLERPLLQALTHEGVTPPVLLIDEVDRSDEQFEAFLLELLSDYQVSIPEYGTVTAQRPPIVVITSNRTRRVSDALKRRCLSLHVEPPSFEAECQIVRRNVPHLDATVASEVCGIVRRLREESFLTGPGVAETLDWARAVATLRSDAEMENLSAAAVERTLTELRAEAAERALVDTDSLNRLATPPAKRVGETGRKRIEPRRRSVNVVRTSSAHATTSSHRSSASHGRSDFTASTSPSTGRFRRSKRSRRRGSPTEAVSAPRRTQRSSPTRTTARCSTSVSPYSGTVSTPVSKRLPRRTT
ncbi:MoxR family ATPase [Haladaptatus sp. R4]|uniref:AAA family ATPase n=1 Tax=Haladaptatus sp. R4 TaxID=1679489 RepID=UPI0009ED70F0